MCVCVCMRVRGMYTYTYIYIHIRACIYLPPLPYFHSLGGTKQKVIELISAVS